MSPERAFQVALRASLAVLLVGLGVLLVVRAWQILEALIVSVVLATALWPWVTAVAHVQVGSRQWHVPRGVAAAVVYVTTFSVAGVAIWLALRALLPEVDRVLTLYPEQTAPLRAYLDPFRTGDLAGGAGKLAQAVVSQATTGQAAPLARQMKGLGMANVRTYINSGNVIFSTRASNAPRLTARVEKALEEHTGMAIKVLLMDHAELTKLVDAIPRSWVDDKTMRTYVLLLCK